MPLLVKLTDSEIELANRVVAQVPDLVEDGRGVLEEIGPAGLLIYQESILPDLHIKPVHGDVQPAGQLGCAERVGIVGPPAAWLAHLDPGGVPDTLNGDWKNLVLAVRRAMTL
jgi:hypothetical protein